MAATDLYSIRLATPSDIDVLVAIDDAATALYAEHGLLLDVPASSAFALDERARWLQAAARGEAFLAMDQASGKGVGFATLGRVDGAPYLDQLAVHPSVMRQGLGRRLLRHALQVAQQLQQVVWLTTYDHLAFNRSFYESEGFVVVPESNCGPDLVHHLEQQRRWLPAPEQRIAMRRIG